MSTSDHKDSLDRRRFSGPTPSSALPDALSVNNQGTHPPTDGGLTGTLTPNKPTLTNPSGVGLLGGANLDADAIIAQQLIAQQALEAQKMKWASKFNDEYVKAKNARINFERQWYLNLAFVGGRQYVAPLDVPGQGFRFQTPKAPPWRVRLVINKIRTAVRTECSKLCSSKPIPTVVPATGENEDYASAKVGEALVRTQFADDSFGEVVRSWVWWGVTCGSSFMKSYWDPNCLDHDVKQLPNIDSVIPSTLPSGEQVPPELQQAVAQSNPKIAEYLQTPQPSKGKIKYEVVTPFHIYVPDLLAERLEDQPFIIHAQTRDPDWVKRSFPDAFPGDSRPATDARAASTIMDSVSVITKGAEDQQDACLVKEIWIKPYGHPDFPDGGLLTIVNERVVQALTQWASPFPEYPFYPYYGIPTGGFYRDSVVQDLIPLQKEYNRTRSQAIEIKNTMGKPRLVYAEGSIDPRRLSSEPGQSVGYTPGYEKPQVMNGVEVPTSFSNEIGTLTSEFDDISGQHDISRGDAPADVKSGTAISFLAEQDDTKLHYQVASIEAAMALVGKHYLSYITKYWEGDRLVKIVGRDNEYEALSWQQNALKGNTDVRIQSGSALPVSKAAKTAQINEWMMNGMLPPEEGFEMLNMGGMDKFLDEVLVDKRQAMRENLKLAQAPVEMLKLFLQPAPMTDPMTGQEMPLPSPMPHPKFPNDPTKAIQFNGDGTPFAPKSPIPVNSWDNHEVHIQYHNLFRKTQEFEVLPPENKQAFELHVQMHQRSMMTVMVDQQGQPLEPEPPKPEPVVTDQNGDIVDPEKQGDNAPNGSESADDSQPPSGEES